MISTATLQDHLGVTGSETVLERLEKGVVTFLESWIPRYLGLPRERSVVLSGGSHREGGLIIHGQELDQILLPEEIAFEDLVSVQYREHPSLPWEDLDEGLEAYEVEGQTLYRRAEPWPPGQRNLRVAFLEGYPEDAGPADVTLVVLELVKAKFDQHTTGNIKSEKKGPVQLTYAEAAAMPGMEAMLKNLKRSVLL